MRGASADRGQFAAVCRELISLHPTSGWWPARSRFEVMAGAVLVQNTRWANVRPALRALRAAGLLDPGRLGRASPVTVARIVRPAGCQRVKTRRLLAMTAGIEAGGGLRRLARLETEPLRRMMLAWHGIGEETADCMLAFAFDRPVFVADAYARRWLQRMGWPAGRRYGEVRDWVEASLGWSAGQLRDLHAAVVLHGQACCGPRPACSACALRRRCATGRRDH